MSFKQDKIREIVRSSEPSPRQKKSSISVASSHSTKPPTPASDPMPVRIMISTELRFDVRQVVHILDSKRTEEVEGAVSSVLSVRRQEQRREDDHAIKVCYRLLLFSYSCTHNMIMRRSDKWLKQAGIVDEDFITTTDTAILFRKMSR